MMNEFEFFDDLTKMGIDKGATVGHLIKLFEMVDNHANETKGIDSIKIHDQLDKQYNLFLFKWFANCNLDKNVFDSVRDHTYNLDEIDLLLDMWRETVIENEVYEMVDSIDFAKRYVQSIRDLNNMQ